MAMPSPSTLGMTVMTSSDIRALRLRLGLSQQGLADRLNTIDPLLKADRNIVSRWERGKNTPNAHYLAALDRLASVGS